MPPSEVAADKLEAYGKTDYRFGRGIDAVTLRIGQRSDALARLFASSGFDCGVFITAYNPLGRALSIEANEAAHGRLVAELKGLSSRVIDAVGADPSGPWQEKSLFAFGVDLEAASNLGIRYRQDAVVWVDESAVPQLILLR